MRPLLYFVVLLASPTSSGQVTLPFHDRFDYPDGDLAGRGAWASASGSGTITVGGENLSYPGMTPSTGKGVNVIPSGSAARTAIAFPSLGSGTLFVSFVFRLQTAPSAQRLVAYLSSSTSSSSSPPLGVFVSASGQLGVAMASSTPGYLSPALGTAASHLVVIAYTFDGTTRSARIWFNPTSLGGAAPEPTATLSGGSVASLGYFLLNTPSASSGGGSYRFDELRIGSTYASTAPGSYPGGGDPSAATPGALRVTAISKADSFLAVAGQGGPAGGGYEILRTSDLTLPVHSWEIFANGNFASDGSFARNLPIDPTMDRAFFSFDPATAPSFGQQPVGRSIAAGQPLSLTAVASGSTSLRYQWYHDGEPVEGADGPQLAILAAEPDNAGFYTVKVWNSLGEITSVPAQVVVGDAPDEARFYISPLGSDSNPGTIDLPFISLQKAISLADPGDTIFMRGGTYPYGQTIRVERSGTAAAPIRIWAYPGEKPYLNFSTQPYGAANRGILFTTAGNHWNVKGLEISHAGDNGIKVEGSHLHFEECVFHHCGDTGLQIGFGHYDANPGGLLAAFVEVIHCDSYLNFDPDSNGGDADGFAAKMHCGQGIVFDGCRAWENSDDGWDLFETDYGVVIRNCWTWKSGVAGGNGNGFKLGGDGTGGQSKGVHYADNCVSFDHKVNGFTQNSHREGLIVRHCLSFGNGNSGYNYFMEGTLNSGHENLFRNNVSIPRSGTNSGGFIADNNPVEQNNTWNLAVTASSGDYVNIAEAAAKAPRLPDGGLPTGFARLIAGSDLIDKGANNGQPFNGTASDLGPYESTP